MNPNPYIKMLRLLLENSDVMTIEFWGEFILGVQRDEGNRHPELEAMYGPSRIPPFFRLRLSGRWWFDGKEEWHKKVESFEIKGIYPIAIEAPLQASILMTKLGRKITLVDVSSTCDLTLNLSDNSFLSVQGIGGGWDENWILELPVDDPDRDKWQIICESQGCIGGKFPHNENARHIGAGC